MAEKSVSPDLVNQFEIDSLRCDDDFDEETTLSQQTLGSSTTRTGKFCFYLLKISK